MNQEKISSFSLRKLIKNLEILLEDILVAIATLAIFIFTSNEALRVYVPLVSLFFVFIFVLVFCLHHFKIFRFKTDALKIVGYFFIALALLWVGSTGWFFSPFFYFLYVASIAMAFLYRSSIATSFVLVLIGILLPQIGSFDINYDILSLCLLLLVIPLSYILRKQYLNSKEKEKKILILQQEKSVYKNKVEEVLSNKIHKIGADIREPLNDIKQLSYVLEKHTPKDKKTYIHRITASAQKALDKLNSFEQEATGNTFRKTP